MPAGKRAEILRALALDHNLTRVAKRIGVSSQTVGRIAKAAGILADGRSERMRSLWANPVFAEIRAEAVSKAAFERREQRHAAQRPTDLKHG